MKLHYFPSPAEANTLGTEALRRVTLDRFPAFVAIDTHGGDLYAEASKAWRTT